jgi:hypothetical protein
MVLASGTGSITVYPDMEAVNGFSGILGPGATTVISTPRTMPDPKTVFDYYKANGTAISVSNLPLDGGGFYFISDEVLSPARNPYGSGTTNPEGIYVIDCLDGKIHIRNSRIVGTLVLLRPGSGSVIYASVNWEPAIENYPALLVDGDMHFALSNAALSEAALGKNFNPAGTPYDGTSDSKMDGTYPSVIKGLVYVAVNAGTNAGLVHPDYAGLPISSTIEGSAVIGVSLIATADMELNYSSVHHDNPPPGFIASVEMVVSPGSWRQSVD